MLEGEEMRYRLAIASWLIALGIAACGSDQATRPSATLHADCANESECSAGESCSERAHPEGTVRSCEIRCTSSASCPAGHACHVPPCLPDDVMCGFCADEVSTSDARCTECLASGGTWQPEADECTEDCDIQDTSCFRDECPGSCADDCAYCFQRSECEAVGCTWRQEAEAAWCS